MNKELNLQIPDSLFLSLEVKAKRQGVSLETLCLSVLEEGVELVNPNLYPSLSNGELRSEVKKLMQSELPPEEVKKRVRSIGSQILRFMKK